MSSYSDEIETSSSDSHESEKKSCPNHKLILAIIGIVGVLLISFLIIFCCTDLIRGKPSQRQKPAGVTWQKYVAKKGEHIDLTGADVEKFGRYLKPDGWEGYDKMEDYEKKRREILFQTLAQLWKHELRTAKRDKAMENLKRWKKEGEDKRRRICFFWFGGDLVGGF